DVAVPSGVWTRIEIPIETTVPPCLEETVPCAQAVETAGNLQVGTHAPLALTQLDQAFVIALDQASLVAASGPDPGAAALVAAGLLALAGRGRRRCRRRGGGGARSAALRRAAPAPGRSSSALGRRRYRRRMQQRFAYQLVD